MKKTILLTLTICSASAFAKPVINASHDTKAAITKTVTETWQLANNEKKNAALTMSQIFATAVAPTRTIRKGIWTALTSRHTACFYNTFSTDVEGRYALKFNVAGRDVTLFDKVSVGGGQAFCVTRFLEIWVKGERPGDSSSLAFTHVEMDGNATDNEGHGTITVR